MVQRAFVVLILTVAWALASLLIIYVCSWSVAALLESSENTYAVGAAVNILIMIGTFIAFVVIARRVLGDPKETNNL